MPIDPVDYFDLSMDELRHVARHAVVSANKFSPTLTRSTQTAPRRHRNNLDLRHGGKRTKLQWVTALDARRAAREANADTAIHVAHGAGDAAAAYLHPMARASQWHSPRGCARRAHYRIGCR